MSNVTIRIGWFTLIVLVLLRVSIGWHFYKEGAAKQTGDSFTSGHFLRAAKGPLSGLYHGILCDPEGKTRLDKNKTLELWKQHRIRAKKHFGFSQEQVGQAMVVYKEYEIYLDVWFADNAEELEEYYNERDRLSQNEADVSTRDIAFQQDRIEEAQRERASELRGFLSQIDRTWNDYETAINGVATAEQRDRQGELSLPRAGEGGIDVVHVDWFIPKFNLIIGVCLILGLLTRPAAIAAALFLFSILLSQPPWVAGAEPVYYQTIEMFGLLAVAAFGAGRWAGLDFLLGKTCCCCRSKKGKEDATNA